MEGLSGKGAENPATGERRHQEQIVTRAPCTETVSFREQGWGSETGHELRQVWAREMQSFSPGVDSRFDLKIVRPGKQERILGVRIGVHNGCQ